MPDLIQEQLIRTRQKQILAAAAKVFAQKGFHATTIRDIAREAGIADGTIYNYFENKTALLLGIFEQMQESLTRRPPEPASSDLRGFIRAYVEQPLMAFRADNFELFRVVISEILINQELRAQYRQNILEPTLAFAEQQLTEWAAKGLIRPLNVGIAVRAVSGLIFGVILEYALDDAVLTAQWNALPDLLTDLVLKGIGAEQP